MKGWNFTLSEIKTAIKKQLMLNPAMELASNICPWNCSFCFTESPENLTSRKHRLSGELGLQDRLALIDQAAALGARTINIVGAGEPTIDPHFWTLIDRMREHDICPIVYSEGALRLTDRGFVKRLFNNGATVVLKVNSLWNAEYQNAVVRGNGTPPKGVESYTERRNKAIEILLEEGFADTEPTRLAFDTIVCKQNRDEIVDLHRYARRRNIFVLMVNYLPSGRSSDGLHDAISKEEQERIFEDLASIDRDEFGLHHRSIFPYAGGVPCSIRGLGLFVKISGQVFDCPGELISLGNVRKNNLKDIWQKASQLTSTFDGRCAPREAFWEARRTGLTPPAQLVQIEPPTSRATGGNTDFV